MALKHATRGTMQMPVYAVVIQQIYTIKRFYVYDGIEC